MILTVINNNLHKFSLDLNDIDFNTLPEFEGDEGYSKDIDLKYKNGTQLINFQLNFDCDFVHDYGDYFTPPESNGWIDANIDFDEVYFFDEETEFEHKFKSNSEFLVKLNDYINNFYKI